MQASNKTRKHAPSLGSSRVKAPNAAKITGDFGERLVLYWLSQHGFECAYIDHVGADIIARNPHTDELMGISVKSRARTLGTEGSTLNIPNDNLVKLKKTCETFGCVPYFAIVVDEADAISVFILSQVHLEKLFPPGKDVIAWKMLSRNVAQYEADPQIMSFRFTTKTVNWWRKQ